MSNIARRLYTRETGNTPYNSTNGEYVKWLEDMVEKRYEPTILKWVKKMFSHAEEKQWFETYWSLDIHGTVSIPDYRKKVKEIEYYPYAKETLQLMSERKDIILIMSTSSYPDEIEIYNKQLRSDGINFNYINENPEISSDKGSFGYYVNKYYFNVDFDDKSGFNPERDWKFLYEYFSTTKYRPEATWDMKYKEDYHKE